jgi:hypothetical protein
MRFLTRFSYYAHCCLRAVRRQRTDIAAEFLTLGDPISATAFVDPRATFDSMRQLDGGAA